MSKTVKIIANRKVTVVSVESVNETLTDTEKEMDRRAKEAVMAAIHRAQVCKKPVAKYDRTKQQVYMEIEVVGRKYV